MARTLCASNRTKAVFYFWIFHEQKSVTPAAGWRRGGAHDRHQVQTSTPPSLHYALFE
jgi:hypothetical protein